MVEIGELPTKYFFVNLSNSPVRTSSQSLLILMSFLSAIIKRKVVRLMKMVALAACRGLTYFISFAQSASWRQLFRFFRFRFFFISKLRVSPFGGRRRCESSQMKLTPPTPLDQAKAEKPSLLAALFTGFLPGLNTHGYSASIFHVAGRLVSS